MTFYVDDIVRLRGFANISGDSLEVEGVRAKVLGTTSSGRIHVKLLRNPKFGDYECEVFPSQCRKIKKKERRRAWVALPKTKFHQATTYFGQPPTTKTDHGILYVRDMTLVDQWLEVQEIIELIEVRKKK